MAPAHSKPLPFKLSGGLFDMLPEAVINHEILPCLRPTERADLQSMILPPDQRVRSPLYALDTLSKDQVSALEEIVEGKRVMAATNMGSAHTAQCLRIKANLYNPARFICGVRQLYELLIMNEIIGKGVPHYMSLLTMDLMLRQDAEFDIETDGVVSTRNRLATHLAWTAAGRISNISTPATSSRSSVASVGDDDDGWQLVDREDFDVVDDNEAHRHQAAVVAHITRRLVRRRNAERQAIADDTESESDNEPPAQRRRTDAGTQTEYHM